MGKELIADVFYGCRGRGSSARRPTSKQIVFLIEPEVYGFLPVGVIGNLAKILDLAAYLLGPIAAGVGKQGKIWARFGGLFRLLFSARLGGHGISLGFGVCRVYTRVY